MTSRSQSKYALYTVLLFVAVALLLGACQAFAPAQSLDQQVAYAYGTHTALMDAAANGVESGALGVEEAKSFLALADSARLALDASRMALGVGDVTTAEGQLKLALNVMTELRDYLNKRLAQP